MFKTLFKPKIGSRQDRKKNGQSTPVKRIIHERDLNHLMVYRMPSCFYLDLLIQSSEMKAMDFREITTKHNNLPSAPTSSPARGLILYFHLTSLNKVPKLKIVFLPFPTSITFY